jgi:hypothetical protein
MPQSHVDLDRAADFIWRSARRLDRARFTYHFAADTGEAVLAALRAYQNADGGFGHALEPDLRDPGSQPAATRIALDMLSEVGALTDPAAMRACDFLSSIAVDGGLPFALPSAVRYPCAPWWQGTNASKPSVVFTAPIVALLSERGVKHPWIGAATEYCWQKVATFDPPRFSGATWDPPRVGTSYQAMAIIHFLDRVDDSRRDEAFERVGRLVLDRGLVELAPDPPGGAHRPLDFATTPGCGARRLFADEAIQTNLDSLVASQQSDGGWMFPWPEWNAATTLEWRGTLTVNTLLLLRAYGRLDPQPLASRIPNPES